MAITVFIVLVKDFRIGFTSLYVEARDAAEIGISY